MTRRPLNADLVGMTFETATSEWTERDVLLYAVGVGARPERDLDFLYEGKGPKVLPTFGVVGASGGMGGLMSTVDIDLKNVLHGEQTITCHRPLPPQARVRTTGRLTEVWDKGKAAVLVTEADTEDDDGPLFTTRSSIFVRNAGGFGGERGPSTAGVNQPPETDPDVVVEDVTRPEQAAIYRLSGDRNPMHIDPGFAKAAGFPGPFLHGLCTYGFVGRALLSALCAGDPSRFGTFSARFADQVWPGDTIITKAWVVGEGDAIVQAETQKGNTVLSQARFSFAG